MKFQHWWENEPSIQPPDPFYYNENELFDMVQKYEMSEMEFEENYNKLKFKFIVEAISDYGQDDLDDLKTESDLYDWMYEHYGVVCRETLEDRLIQHRRENRNADLYDYGYY